MSAMYVSELDGKQLDAAVALALGITGLDVDPGVEEQKDVGWHLGEASAMYGASYGIWMPVWRPSSSWAQGGPIIERERIGLDGNAIDEKGESGFWWATSHGDSGADMPGPTPLIAAMRAYVASKFGETVELPLV